MNNVTYHINKDKGVVVAVIKFSKFEAENIFFKIVSECLKSSNANNSAGLWFCLEKSLTIEKQYVGIARCNKGDIFNEDFGKRLALARAKAKSEKAIYKTFFNIVDALDDVTYAVGKKYDKLVANYFATTKEIESLLMEANK